MLFGYMDRICRIDLSSGQIQYEKSPESMYRKYVGGYGVGARLLLSEMRANVDPLGPENILGFVIGPLTGTQAQIGSSSQLCANRLLQQPGVMQMQVDGSALK